MIEVSSISEIKPEKRILFSNGQEISIDSIILTTGYSYSFPFLAPETTGVRVEDKKRITPLYKQTFNSLHPNMDFAVSIL